MSQIFYVLEDDGKIREMTRADLYFWYKAKGLVDMADIKYVGWVDEEFIPKRLAMGDNVFREGEVIKPRKIRAYANKKLFFEGNSIEEAIAFCKEQNLSRASDKMIQSIILKNLQNKTRSGYGLEWKIEYSL